MIPSGRTLHEHIFTELIGVELWLTNALGPLPRGERLTQEQSSPPGSASTSWRITLPRVSSATNRFSRPFSSCSCLNWPLYCGTDREGAEAGRGASTSGGADPASGDHGANAVSVRKQGTGDRPDPRSRIAMTPTLDQARRRDSRASHYPWYRASGEFEVFRRIFEKAFPGIEEEGVRPTSMHERLPRSQTRRELRR